MHEISLNLVVVSRIPVSKHNVTAPCKRGLFEL